MLTIIAVVAVVAALALAGCAALGNDRPIGNLDNLPPMRTPLIGVFIQPAEASPGVPPAFWYVDGPK
jgi:hypothetical protein